MADHATPNPHACRSASGVVTAMLQAVASKRYDDAALLMTDDIAFDNVPIGVVIGREATLEMLSNGFLSQSADAEWRIDREVENGSVVMSERTDRFLVGDTWIEIPVAGVFEVRHGQVALWRDYCDLGTMERQITPELKTILASHYDRVHA